MADSLFDNRYRYDYIYPRGRSGETLRAVDTQENDRPVVIKRPAPNDAPPIRSGQEVSILNERKALSRLSGHSALTTLLGTGQFFVGGISHQYIVVERAEGQIVADMVLELAARGERMPELELLVIVDTLLDLLTIAHQHDIVYNDVDAKHLYWNRDTYNLKVIDWGNAIFLEGDEVTAQGISRQSDVYQVGELLYFVLTGGSRMEAPRDAGDDFRLNFGEDSERLHSRLQAIVSRAAHPNQRLRYRTIEELRKDLTDYRQPLERERNAILGRVNSRLRHDLSKDELNALMRTLEPALALDPGYPAALQTQEEVFARLSDLEVAADLDAARIYLESAHWQRAIAVLNELGPRARGETAVLIALLLDWATLLLENETHPTPPAVREAIGFVFVGDASSAANILLMQGVSKERIRALQWLLAERISAHVPEVLLLRPNLYRLDLALAKLASEGIEVSEMHRLLAEIDHHLDELGESGAVSLIKLRDGYRLVVDQLTALSTLVESVQGQQQLPNHLLPLSALERALNAAMALADNMHVIGKQATTSPRDAMGALDSCRQIAPATPAWDSLDRLLTNLYELLGSYQTYIPAADGSDLESWLKTSQFDLEPFTERLFDEMLVGMVNGLKIASGAWASFAEATVQGNRIGAMTAMAKATEAVGTVSPTLAGWLNQLRTIITNAQYVERHSLYGALGRALADGWEHFDRGRLSDAERLGIQAYEAARSDAERFAAQRLRDLAQISREWVERGGVSDESRTKATLTSVELLYLADEIGARDNFNAQMPSKETYLRAMGKGLVEVFGRDSTASVRILFVNYVLLGALDAHDDTLDDAEFWQDAALRTLGESATRHPMIHALEEYIVRRRDLILASTALNKINGKAALPTLETTRRALETNSQARVLAAGVHSLREIEAGVRDWSDGDFRAAGIKLENALRAVDEVESAAQITLTSYRAWLMELIQSAAELHATSRRMAQVIESRPEQPVDSLGGGHQLIVDVTTRLLGESYAATPRQWRDTYQAFVELYTDRSQRRSAKLVRFSELFRAMFIDRHPAYPLYRHWHNLTEQSPEFPAPPTDEPVPRVTDEAVSEAVSGYEDDFEADADRGGRRFSPVAIVGLVGGLVVLVVAALIAARPPDSPSGGLNAGTGTVDRTAQAIILEVTTALAAASQTPSTSTPTPTATNTRFNTPTEIISAATIAPRGTESITPSRPPSDTMTFTPSNTPTPSNTSTRTTTSTSTFTPPPTLPPQGAQGTQNLLELANLQPEPLWNSEQFAPGEVGGVWRLGVGSLTEGGTIFVAPSVDVLESAYGNDPANRINVAEAELSLIVYNPPLLAEDGVYFGVLLQSADDPALSMGVQVNLVNLSSIRLSQRVGESLETISQRSDDARNLRVRLERDSDAETITVYVDNQQLGNPLPFEGDEPVVPVLFVRQGGVIVHVLRWSITLR
jgi:hypothetical protein